MICGDDPIYDRACSICFSKAHEEDECPRNEPMHAPSSRIQSLNEKLAFHLQKAARRDNQKHSVSWAHHTRQRVSELFQLIRESHAALGAVQDATHTPLEELLCDQEGYRGHSDRLPLSSLLERLRAILHPEECIECGDTLRYELRNDQHVCQNCGESDSFRS